MDQLPRAEAALRFLAEVSATLGESLDYALTIKRVIRLAIPTVADWCTIDLLDEAGVMRRIAAGHRDPAVEQELLQVRRRQTQWGAPVASQEVLREGKSLLYPVMDADTRAKYIADPEVRALVERLGNASGMLVPMLVRGRAIGAMSFSRSGPERPCGPEDLALAEEFARRAAAAIDNARLYDNAQRAIRVRDEFLTVASHELNAPLASLQMLVDGLGHGVSTPLAHTPEALGRTVETLARQVRRLGSLVGDLLQATRLQVEQPTLELDQVDLVAVAREMLRRLADELGRAGCKVTVTAPDSLTGLWDRARVSDILLHLMSNAVKFGPKRPIELEITSVEGAARLVVQDHGIGIPAERVPHIFNLFERAVPAANYGGLGLGLYIVRETVRSLGGKVSAESVEGQGARFTVELPRS
jgi:signal transduction histidine kinase